MSDQPSTSPLGGTTPPKVSESERARRLDFMHYVMNDAEPWHREHLGRLYADWDRYNEAYFGGVMVPAHILLSEPSNPRRLGDCGTVSGFGAKSQIRIRPSLLTGTHPCIRPAASIEGRYLLVTDILLHEMIHQYHQEITGIREESYHGHGPAFQAECNRIGKLLGLAPVRVSKKRGPDKNLPSCSYWPDVVRPADYYLGAYGPPARVAKRSVSIPSDPDRRRDAFARLLSADDARAWIADLVAVFDLDDSLPRIVPISRDISQEVA